MRMNMKNRDQKSCLSARSVNSYKGKVGLKIYIKKIFKLPDDFIIFF